MPTLKKTLKRIAKDRKQLQENKLEGIHVIWDSDEDLFHLKAMIIGPEGTPYEKGLFFFDIEFTKKYFW